MASEHSPPQLSPDGARLLADVLAARQSRTEVPSSDEIDQAAIDRSRDRRPLRAVALVPLVVVAGGLAAALALALGMLGESGEPNVEAEVAGIVELAPVSADGLSVTIDRVGDVNDGVRLVDLTIELGPTRKSLSTDRFDFVAVDSSGQQTTTIARFVEAEVAAGDVARAMLRLEGAVVDVDLTVLLDDVVIERLSLS